MKATKKYLYKGEEFTLTDLSLKFFINIATLSNRLSRGWSVEKAVEKKISSRKEKGIWAGV